MCAAGMLGLGLVMLATLLGGCHRGPAPLTPVSGKVAYQNRTLAGGTIVFTPDSAKGGSGQMAVGKITQDGSYYLYTGESLGASAGWYRITVTSFAATGVQYPGQPPNLALFLFTGKISRPGAFRTVLRNQAGEGELHQLQLGLSRMNHFLHGVVRALSETFTLPGPILEIGSYQVAGQESIGNLRELFPGALHRFGHAARSGRRLRGQCRKTSPGRRVHRYGHRLQYLRACASFLAWFRGNSPRPSARRCALGLVSVLLPHSSIPARLLAFYPCRCSRLCWRITRAKSSVGTDRSNGPRMCGPWPVVTVTRSWPTVNFNIIGDC